MASDNITRMMEQAQRALREGKRVEAQEFLLRITELDQYNEDAWLWLASAVATEEEKRTCLDNVLIINQDNAQAKQMLAQLDRGEDVSMPGGGAPPAFDAGGTDLFGAAPPGEDPFGAVYDDADDTASGGDAADGPFSASPPPTTSPTSDTGSFGGGSLFDDEENEEEANAGEFSGGIYDDDDLLDDLNSVDDEADEEDGEDPMSLIPLDIEPTRLPGSDEEPSAGLVTGIRVVGALVAVAALALVVQAVLFFL